MSSPDTTFHFDDIVAEINGLVKRASTKADGGISDPAEKGTAAPKKDPETTPEAQNMPPSATNGKADPGMETKDTGAKGTGEGTSIHPKDGNQDEKDTGMKSAEIRKQAKELAERVLQFTGKNASKPQAPAAGEGGQGAANAAGGPGSDPEKIASDMDPEIFHKVAQLVLGDERGQSLVEELAREKFGEEAAEALIKSAAESEEALREWNEYEQSGAAAVDAFLSDPGVPQTEKQAFVRRFTAYEQGVRKWADDPMTKMAYDEGVKASMALGPVPADDEAAMTEALGGDPGQLSPEEMEQLIIAMIQAGEIPEEVGMALLAELGMGGGGGGGEEIPEEIKEAMQKSAAFQEKAMAAAGSAGK